MNDKISLKLTKNKIVSFSLKHIYYIYILLIIVFSLLTVFIRKYVAGVDTYYYINHICYGTAIDKPILSTFIFDLLPCNMLVFKLIQILLLVSVIILVSILGKQFNKEYGYLAGIFLFLGLSLPYELLGNLEPQQLALPFIILTFIFIVKFINIKKYNKYKIFNFILSLIFCILSCLIWDGSYFLIIIYIIIFPLLLIPSVIFLILRSDILIYFFNRIVPSFSVYENMPIIAIIYWLFLLIGVPQMIKTDMKKKCIFLFLLILGIINAKYSILVVPLLAVGIMLLFIEYINKEDVKKYAKAISLLFFIPIIFIFALIGIYSAMPTNNIISDISTAHQYSIDNNYNFENDWGLGYFSQFLGYNVKYKGSNSNYYDYNNSIVVSIKNSNIDLDLNNRCEKLDITNYINSYYCNE